MNLLKETFKCTVCSKIFRSQLQLELHAAIHIVVETYNCDHCDAKFFTRSELKEHIEAQSLIRKSFNCLHCSASFFHKSHLERHLQMASNDTNSFCLFCPEQFLTFVTLQEHMGNKHFCDIQGFRLTSAERTSQLKNGIWYSI